jgi:hypothetical protein
MTNIDGLKKLAEQTAANALDVAKEENAYLTGEHHKLFVCLHEMRSAIDTARSVHPLIRQQHIQDVLKVTEEMHEFMYACCKGL